MEKIGASEGIRTLDVHLGKVMLYQLSYARFPDKRPAAYASRLARQAFVSSKHRRDAFIENLNFGTDSLLGGQFPQPARGFVQVFKGKFESPIVHRNQPA